MQQAPPPPAVRGLGYAAAAWSLGFAGVSVWLVAGTVVPDSGNVKCTLGMFEFDGDGTLPCIIRIPERDAGGRLQCGKGTAGIAAGKPDEVVQCFLIEAYFPVQAAGIGDGSLDQPFYVRVSQRAERQQQGAGQERRHHGE